MNRWPVCVAKRAVNAAACMAMCVAMVLWTSPVFAEQADDADRAAGVESSAVHTDTSAEALTETASQPSPARGVDPVVMALDPAAITGYEELPRIMHIVPWKAAGPGDVPGRPADSLLDEIIAPLERDVFRRQLRYHDALNAADPATPGF